MGISIQKSKVAKLPYSEIKFSTSISFPKTFQNSFYFNSLPKIPKCYKQLEELLLEFNKKIGIIRTMSTSQKKSNSRKKVFKRRLNGFIAYRSYYSKNIHDSSLQIEVSKRLAIVWKNDPSANIWKRYAFEYNKSNENISFLSWLDNNVIKPKNNPKNSFSVDECLIDFEVLNFICNVEEKFVS